MRNNMGNFVIHCGLAISASPFTYGIACGVKPNFLQWIFSKEHAADIGYVLSRNLWGGGYMTEAANAVVEWAINLSSLSCLGCVRLREQSFGTGSGESWDATRRNS
jgi:RimJ/RimL family protein N-acetyltransferase